MVTDAKPKRERMPIIHKSRIAYQEFLSDEEIRNSIDRIIQATWDQARLYCAVSLDSVGDEVGAKHLRSLRRPTQ